VEHKHQPGWKPWKPPPEKRDRWGLRGKTAWDWLSLLVVPVMLALVVGVFTTLQIFIQIWQENERQQDIASQTAQVQRVLEEFRVQEASLQAYLDLMATLLLEHDLRESAEGSEVRAIARAQTLATLRKQDAEGKSTIVRFLIDAGLLQASPSDGRGGAVLRLAGAELNWVDLTNADLEFVDFAGTNLSSATLNGADLHGVDLTDANLSGANLSGANLSGAILSRSNLSNADLSETDLRGADLSSADLSGAKLSVSGVKRSNAVLDNANLSDADLSGTEGITNEELEQQAASLKGATMPKGQTYKEWLKDKEAARRMGRTTVLHNLSEPRGWLLRAFVAKLAPNGLGWRRGRGTGLRRT
jgi:uncharacterized protein YjbI with pentapeptide repeats